MTCRAAGRRFDCGDRRRLRGSGRLAFFIPAFVLLAGSPWARDLDGDLPTDLHLNAADSPVLVRQGLRVPEGLILSIEPGVEFRLGEGACIVVEGEIQALGERRERIVFRALDEGLRWGNLKIIGNKDLPSYDGDYNYIEGGGSRLLSCDFLGGGLVPDVEYDGGALYLNGSAPVVRDCLFRDNAAERGGGVVCHNFATPLIEGCTFEENEALLDDGGAIYCFFYSDAVISRNFIVHNVSARNGGGIYVSVSSPVISQNALIDNAAGMYGGAMFISSSSPRVLDNALFQHRAQERSTGIVFQSDCQPEVRGNSLLSGEIEVLGLNLSYDLDLSENWWGTENPLLIDTKIHQRARGRESRVTADPWLDKPPENLLTQPVEIHSLQVLTDKSWADTLSFDLVETCLARVEIRAVDRNPYAVDQTAVVASVLERPDQRLTLILLETDAASGVFRAKFYVSREADTEIPVIWPLVGEHLLLVSAVEEKAKQLYRVDLARPVVHDMAIVSDPDPTHLIEHQLRVSWEYFDLLGHAQQAWQLQVGGDSLFDPPDQWDSGERTTGAGSREATYAGSDLRDGERYFFRMRIKGGGAWSAWRTFMVRSDNPEFSFRLNSLPPVPALLQPAEESILPVTRPGLSVDAVADLEGDPVYYEFQVSPSEYFRQVVASSDRQAQIEPRWSPEIDLQDNGSYYWRVRVYDGYETGEWSAARHFYLNPVEQAPAVFGLLEPEGRIADVSPLFRWEEARDPDPGSSVSYTFLLSSRQDLGEAERVTGLEALEFQRPGEIANLSRLYWTVEAVDNTGRSQRAAQAREILVDTTPSRPVALFPEDDKEIRADEVFRITESTDPWPEDRLSYEIQLSGDGDFDRPLVFWRDLTVQDLAVTGIDAYPEARLLSDDRRYFWRLRAVDNHGAASEWSKVKAFWFNRRNDPPSRPESGLSPGEGITVTELPPLLWQPSSDTDHSDPPHTLRYAVQLAASEDFSGEIIERILGPDTRLDAGSLIPDNQLWHWRVQARDDEGAASEWSPLQSFVYNRGEDPPAPFVIQEPASGSRPYLLDRMFLVWAASEDPDWNSSLTYFWEVAGDEAFSQLVARGETSNTTAEPRLALESRRDYWVRLRAVDDTGLETLAPVHRISVDSHPSPPVPAPMAEELGLDDHLSWEASRDPNPNDRLAYTVLLTDPGGRPLVEVEGFPGTNVVLGQLPGVKGLEDNIRLGWKVIARDPHGLSAEGTGGAFWFNRVNEAPGAPHFSSDLADNAVWQQQSPQLPFGGAADPDPSDPPESLGHELQFATSGDFRNPQVLRIPPGVAAVSGLNLSDNTRWFLRLRATDDEGSASAWSETLRLVVNLADDPPTAPGLLIPANRVSHFDLDGLHVRFSPSQDPDVDAKLSYRLELDRAGAGRASVRETEETDLRWNQALENGASYLLRVVAVDETGLESASQPASFTVDTTPGAVQLAGVDGVILGSEDELSWNAAVDPDPNDVLVYEVQAARGRSFADATTVETSSTRLSAGRLASRLTENGEAFLRVRARDDQGITGVWSNMLGIVWDALNEAPGWQGKLSPASGKMRENEPLVRWSPPKDPDRRPQELGVEIEIAADRAFGQVLVTKRFPASAGQGQVRVRENHERWLRARAYDQGQAASDWCPAVHYVVDAQQEAPGAPELRSPADGRELRGGATFSWSAAEDPDPGDRVRYRLEVSRDQEGPIQRMTGDTQAELELGEAGDYSWRVVAIDGTGRETPSPSRSFRVAGP